MPKRTVILKSQSAASEASSDKDKIARPDIKAITAEEEIRADEKADEKKDLPDPGAKPDNRQRCAHGRLFKCQQCEALKGQKTPEELARRRERLEDMSCQFHESLFNLIALIGGEESFRLTKEEKHGLGKTGATAVEEVAPETSIKAIAVVGYAVTVAGCVTGKIWDAAKASKEKKDKAINRVLDEKGKPDAERPPADNGHETNGKDVSGPPLLRIP